MTPEEEILAPLSIAIMNFVIVKSMLTSEANIPLAFAFVGCVIGLILQRHRLPEVCGEVSAPPGPGGPVQQTAAAQCLDTGGLPLVGQKPAGIATLPAPGGRV